MGTQGGMGLVCKITVSNTLTALVHLQTGSSLPEFEKILKDVTGHDAAGKYAKLIATGKRKANPFNVKLLWDASEATHAAVQAAFDSDDPVAMSVESPDGNEVLAGEAHINKIGRTSEQEDGYMANVQVSPTGQWTVTPSSGS